LISIDTCRADHLGCYGDPRGLTPNLDALAREGVRFASAITPFPMTLPAHCSMLNRMSSVISGAAENLDAGAGQILRCAQH
jgi:arylsulfatase A-like enzyme